MEKFNQPKQIEIMGKQFSVDSDGYVEIGDVARTLLNMQGQYGARYADDSDQEYPNFGTGLRVKGNAGNYHSMKIHGDDVVRFVTKVTDYKNQT